MRHLKDLRRPLYSLYRQYTGSLRTEPDLGNRTVLQSNRIPIKIQFTWTELNRIGTEKIFTCAEPNRLRTEPNSAPSNRIRPEPNRTRTEPNTNRTEPVLFVLSVFICFYLFLFVFICFYLFLYVFMCFISF